MGMFLRRGKVGPFTVALTENGSAFSSSYAYATVDGTKYTDPATLELAYGSIVEVYVSGRKASHQALCYVTLDGETVQDGAGTYSYKVTRNATLTFGENGNGKTCDIVTS